MCVLFLLGITGLYARQVEAAGWLGLAGFLLFSLNWVLTAPFTVAEVFILPVLATEAPTLAEGFLGAQRGRMPARNVLHGVDKRPHGGELVAVFQRRRGGG
jgi:hypothetical protein